MTTYKKLKSILYCGMLFLCNSLWAYGLPEILTDSDQKKYHVQFIQQKNERSLIELIPMDESNQCIWSGMLCKDTSLMKSVTEVLYCYGKHDPFYFLRLQRREHRKKRVYMPIKRIGTDYENEINALTPIFIED